MNEKTISLLDRSVGEALSRQATDLFLIPGEPPLVRVNGEIERLDGPAVEAPELQRVAETLIGAERLEKIGPEIGEITTRNGLPEEANARLSIARAQGGLTFAVTLLPGELYPPDALGVPEALLRVVSDPTGLILITGPVGSGMQTVGCSLVDYLNSREASHITTVEDPIRVRFTPKKAMIQQREVGVDIPDAAEGVRTSLRQDADTIFVNQVRSVEGVEACLAAAESGHRVILVLHVSTTPEETIQRLIDAFPEHARSGIRRSLARVLRCVSIQRLLNRTDKGRVAAFGLLIPDADRRRALAEGEDWRRRTGPPPEGCLSIVEETRRLEREGIVTPESARRVLAEFEA